MINKKIGLIILLYLVTAIVAISGVSAAEKIYLDDSNGDDNNDGSQSAAVKTMSKAIAMVSDDGTIHVAGGTYTGADNTDLTINKDVTIVGENNKVVFDAKGKSRIFDIEKANVKLINLNFINGKEDSGGSIKNYGDLTIVNCSFNDSQVSGGDGGAIYSEGGVLNVSGSNFINNDGAMSGGAIAALAGELHIFNSSFVSNRANSTDSNGAYGGGAIFTGVNLYVINSTFVNNSAIESGGAIFTGDHLYVINSTFVNNSAIKSGGAILGNDVVVNGSNFENNTAKSGNAISIEGSLTANYNRFANNGEEAIFNDEGIISSVDYNWWGSNNLSTSGVDSLVNSYYFANITKDGKKAKYTLTLNGTDSTEGTGNLPVFYGNSTYGDNIHETWDARLSQELNASGKFFAQIGGTSFEFNFDDDSGSSGGDAGSGGSSGSNGGSGGSSINDAGSNGNGDGFNGSNDGGFDGSYGNDNSSNGNGDGFNGSNDSKKNNGKGKNKNNNTRGRDVNPGNVDKSKSKDDYHDSGLKDVSNRDSSKASPGNSFAANKGNLVDMENTGLPVNLLIAVIAMLSMVIVRKKG